MKLLTLFVLLITSSFAWASGVALHVSPGGDDAAAGNEAAPLASLEAARDRIRAHRASGEGGTFVVRVHPGIYVRRTALQLGEADSGTADAPVIYTRHGDAPARLIGGVRIERLDAVSDPAVLARLPDTARAHVRHVDLRAVGIKEFGKPFGQGKHAPIDVSFKGEPMKLARWPNRGWATIGEVPGGKDGSVITYAGNRPARWTDAPDAWLLGYWFHGWAEDYVPLAAIKTDNRTLRLGGSTRYGLRKNQRWRAMNLIEELDEPGEWYVDRAAGVLYVWLPAPLESGDLIVSTLREPFLEMTEASHVRIEGLSFEAACNQAVEITGGTDVTLCDCVIRTIGKGGVMVNGGNSHRVIGCELGHLGAGGIVLSGGDRKKLQPAGHQATDNHIHHYGRTRRTYQTAIKLAGVGQIAAHNHIHHAPHMGLGYSGNDHRIEANDIHHVLLETDDAGAIYTGRDWSARGTVIHHNYIHHSGPDHAPPPPADAEPGIVFGPLAAHGANLIYCDDTAAGTTITGNILHGGDRAVLIGGGRDHLIANNIVFDSKIGIWIDGRGLGWARKNIARGGAWGMYDRLASMPYRQPPWSERYPELATMLENNPAAPLGNRVLSNIFVGVEHWKWLQGEAKESHVEFADNLADVKLDGDDPLRKTRCIPAETLKGIGFKAIPVSTIGPRR